MKKEKMKEGGREWQEKRKEEKPIKDSTQEKQNDVETKSAQSCPVGIPCGTTVCSYLDDLGITPSPSRYNYHGDLLLGSSPLKSPAYYADTILGSSPLLKGTLLLPPIGVFWDIENCQVPKGKSAMVVAQALRERFFKGHREAEFMCVCDITKENSQIIQQLNDAQVNVIHVASTCKNAADDKLRQSMRRFADIHGPPATIILISGDINFTADLSDLRHRKKLHVVLLHNPHAPEALVLCANENYCFDQLMTYIPASTPAKSNSLQNTLLVTNLPEDREIKLRTRLRQLSDNCGGRVASVTGGSALIRFPNSESATRARKRMEGEDVFGNKISVSFPSRVTQLDGRKDESAVPQAIGRRTKYDEGRSRENSPQQERSPYRSKAGPFPPPPNPVEMGHFPPPPNPAEMGIFSTLSSPVDIEASKNKWKQREKSASLENVDHELPVMNEKGRRIADRERNHGSNGREPFRLANSRDSSADGTSHSPPMWHPTWKLREEVQAKGNRISINGIGANKEGWETTPQHLLIDKTPEGYRRIRGTYKASRPVEDGCFNPVASNLTQSFVQPASYKGEMHVTLHQHQDRAAFRRYRTPSPVPSTFSNAPSPTKRPWSTSPKPDWLRYDRKQNRSEGSSFQNDNLTTGPAQNDSSQGIASSPVELQVTNLDQTIEAKEMKRMLLIVFREHVMVLHVSVFLQSDGNLAATVKVPSIQDAQYAISQLHRKKIGYKRILISYSNNTGPAPHILRSEVIALLSEVPGSRLPLFKFRELFEKRYHTSIGVSELYRMRDVVVITEESTGRMISLSSDYRHSQSPLSEGSQEMQLESPYCTVHWNEQDDRGWAERELSTALPNVNIGLKSLALSIHTLLQTHDGTLPLSSLPICYAAEFEELDIQEEGVPLEHLVSCIPGIQIVTGVSNIKYIQWQENRVSDDSQGEENSRSVSPPLAGQLALFSRELVDLLKTAPHCRMLFSKFIPAYHHHFGRQCRVADYGFTKLIELFENLTHVVQMMSEGNKKTLTLAHRAQVKRFTSDLLRVLKSQASKQVTLSQLPSVYEKCMNRPFDITDYGVCETGDMLSEVCENIVVMSVGEDTVIAIPKREQTPEEIEHTKQFAVEVVELLRHAPECCMQFNKYIPAYHHHYARQCRVSDYGFTKLIELFEAIPHVVEIFTDEDGERCLQLTEKERLKVIADQIVNLVKASRRQAIPPNKLAEAYTHHFGFTLKLEAYGVTQIEELFLKIRHAVKVVQTRDGPLITLVDRGFVHQLGLHVRHILMEQIEGRMAVTEFQNVFRSLYNQNCNMEVVKRDLGDVVKVDGEGEDSVIQLIPLQMFARDVMILLHDSNGRLTLSAFDMAYLDRFGVPCRPAQYGYPSIVALLQAIPEVVFLRGKGHKRVLLLNRETAGSPIHKLVKQQSPTKIIQNQQDGLQRTCGQGDGHVGENEEELVQLAVHPPSPVDLLSAPVPSAVPSPDLQPLPEELDLMRFDSPCEVQRPDVIDEVPPESQHQFLTSPVDLFLKSLILGQQLGPGAAQVYQNGMGQRQGQPCTAGLGQCSGQPGMMWGQVWGHVGSGTPPVQSVLPSQPVPGYMVSNVPIHWPAFPAAASKAAVPDRPLSHVAGSVGPDQEVMEVPSSSCKLQDVKQIAESLATSLSMSSGTSTSTLTPSEVLHQKESKNVPRIPTPTPPPPSELPKPQLQALFEKSESQEDSNSTLETSSNSLDASETCHSTPTHARSKSKGRRRIAAQFNTPVQM